MTTLAEALAHHQAGRLAEAEQLYRQILEVDPRHVDALHLFGVVALQVGRSDLACIYIGEALRLNPNHAEAHNDLGNALAAQGKLPEAMASLREALRLRPDFAEAHNNLGNVLAALQRLDEAAASYREALRLNPAYADAHNNLGNVLASQQRLEQAVASYRQAVRLHPTYADAHKNLGSALLAQCKFLEAAASFREALRLKPDFAEALNSLGDALKEHGDLPEAVARYQESVRLYPNYAAAHNNLGTALLAQGKLPEAAVSYREALRLKPDFAEAHNNLGSVLAVQASAQDEASFREALRLKPDLAEAHHNLGLVLRQQGRLDEAVARWREALRLKPDNRAARASLVHGIQHLCLWDDLEKQVQLVEAAVMHPAVTVTTDVVPPFIFLSLPTSTSPQQQLQCASTFAQQILRPTEDVGSRPVRLARDNVRSRLRIGYLSGDFQTHPVAQLTAELFEQHDRARFEVYGYSLGRDDGGSMRRRLIRAFDRFVDLRDSSIQEAAQQIEQDEVDILIDLTGYTTDARSEILARRPAPIQVNYLGYPGTMGAPFMDYMLVDEFVVPPDQQPFYAEQLVYLPGCYQVNDSRREIARETPTRAACGLPEEGLVFCCFNHSYKITPAMFSVWMRVLEGAPGSVLWLLESNRWAPANLRREAEARGVAADRLVFAPLISPAEHLARHRLADLFLDTYPYNAHTTASDALWAGCPLLTLTGQTFASRVAGSLLRALGLRELIASSLEEYEAMALELTRKANKMAEVRARLVTNRRTSSLFDGRQFARKIETAFASMWEMHAAGRKPRGFEVTG